MHSFLLLQLQPHAMYNLARINLILKSTKYRVVSQVKLWESCSNYHWFSNSPVVTLIWHCEDLILKFPALLLMILNCSLILSIGWQLSKLGPGHFDKLLTWTWNCLIVRRFQGRQTRDSEKRDIEEACLYHAIKLK